MSLFLFKALFFLKDAIQINYIEYNLKQRSNWLAGQTCINTVDNHLSFVRNIYNKHITNPGFSEEQLQQCDSISQQALPGGRVWFARLSANGLLPFTEVWEKREVQFVYAQDEKLLLLSADKLWMNEYGWLLLCEGFSLMAARVVHT